MPLVIEPLRHDDIAEIGIIERESFPTPWPASAYRREIDNRLAHYFVLREVASADLPPLPPEPQGWQRLTAGLRRAWHGPDPAIISRGRIVGFAGLWIIIDEAHLTTIAVREVDRGKGYGELMVQYAIEAALARGALTMTLEVRVSNEAAQALYRKYGFHIAGRRKNYYTDIREDAYIMTSEPLGTADYRDRFCALTDALTTRLAGQLAGSRS